MYLRICKIGNIQKLYPTNLDDLTVNVTAVAWLLKQ